MKKLTLLTFVTLFALGGAAEELPERVRESKAYSLVLQTKIRERSRHRIKKWALYAGVACLTVATGILVGKRIKDKYTAKPARTCLGARVGIEISTKSNDGK